MTFHLCISLCLPAQCLAHRGAQQMLLNRVTGNLSVGERSIRERFKDERRGDCFKQDRNGKNPREGSDRGENTYE